MNRNLLRAAACALSFAAATAAGAAETMPLAQARAVTDQTIDLVESNRKKASFLQSVIGQFDLPARVLAKRIDDSYALVSAPEIVTARALAALPDLLDLAAPWLTKRARALFHKGRDYRAEVEESTHRWAFDLVEHSSTTDPHGVILEITDLRPAKQQ